MKDYQDQYSVTKMARVLGVSRSGYYAWLGRQKSKRAQEEQELLELIRQIFTAHHGRYGSPRVWRELRDKHGRRVGRKRVERLMREHGMRARGRRTWVNTTDSRHNLPVAENLLGRDFNASGAGQKWVSDITYLSTASGWLYLTIVLDLWDRKVIGWAIAGDLRAEHVQRALRMACANRQPQEGLIFHSDRGVQYCCGQFRGALREECAGVRQSMSRKGNCWDNACAESFFKTLKRELEVLDGKHTKAGVRTGVFEYIEIYYNKKRRHSALGYATPVEVAGTSDQRA
jgi:transposase InsO family protein